MPPPNPCAPVGESQWEDDEDEDEGAGGDGDGDGGSGGGAPEGGPEGSSPAGRRRIPGIDMSSLD